MKRTSKPTPAGTTALFTGVRLAVHTGQRMIYPFLPIFARGMHIGLYAIAYAIAFSFVTSVISPFLGPVADRHGRKLGILFGLLVFAAGLGLVAVFPNVIAFTLMLLITNLGANIVIPCMHAYLSELVPYRRRGLVLAITEVAWALSFIVFIPLVAILIDRTNWRVPFAALAGLTLISAVLIGWLIPDDSAERRSAEVKRFKIRQFLSSPMAVYAIVLGIALTSANQVVTVVFSTWLEDVYSLQIVALGMASLLIGFSELGGEGLAAWLVDRLGKERSVMLGLGINALVALVVSLLGGSLGGAIAWLFLFFLTFEFAIVCCLPLMTEVMPRSRATLMAFFIGSLSLGRGVGALVAPLLYRYGIFYSGLGAALFNALAIVMLTRIKVKEAA
jgi:predicted MFS family arabinose efflux permease